MPISILQLQLQSITPLSHSLPLPNNTTPHPPTPNHNPKHPTPQHPQNLHPNPNPTPIPLGRPILRILRIHHPHLPRQRPHPDRPALHRRRARRPARHYGRRIRRVHLCWRSSCRGRCSWCGGLSGGGSGAGSAYACGDLAEVEVDDVWCWCWCG